MYLRFRFSGTSNSPCPSVDIRTVCSKTVFFGRQQLYAVPARSTAQVAILVLTPVITVMLKSSQWLGKTIVPRLVVLLQESIDRCTGRRDVNEILLKTNLNTVRSINQLMHKIFKCGKTEINRTFLQQVEYLTQLLPFDHYLARNVSDVESMIEV